MPNATVEGSPGLVTAASPAAAPPGALTQAYGLAAMRSGLLQKQRPFRQYSYGGDSTLTDPVFGSVIAPDGIGYYGGRLLLVNSAGLLFREGLSGLDVGTGIFASTGAQVALPGDNSSTRPTMHLAEAVKNAYIPGKGTTTYAAATAPNTGLMCLTGLDHTSFTVREAGLPRVPDLSLTEVNSGSLLTIGQSRAYRACLYFTDASGVTVRSAPSGRVVLTASGSTRDVSIKMYLPQRVLKGASMTFRWEVYATKIFATSTTPDEEYQLIADLNITATDLSNGYATFTDNVPDTMRSANLYTSPSQGGAIAANEQPPIGLDIAWFKQFMLLSNTTQRGRAISQALSYPEFWAIQSITANSPNAGQSTYLFASTVDLTGFDNTFKLAVVNSTGGSNDGTWAIADVNTGGFTHGIDNTNHKIVVTNAGVAQAGVAGTAISGQLVVGNLTYYPIFAAESASSRYFTVPSTGTISAVVQSMVASLLRVVNQQNGVISGAGTSNVVGYNMSGDTDAPGKILWEEVSIGGSFTVYAKGTTTVGYANAYSNKFAPTMTAAVPLTSFNDAKSNRVHYSKYGEPEHFPLTNYLDIGSARHKILRLVPLRNATLVFKQDGLFRITSDGTNVYWSVVDPTQVLLDTELVYAVQNQACAVTNRGPWLFTEASALYIGASVQDMIDRVCSPNSTVLASAGRDISGNAKSRVSASSNDGLIYFYFNKSNSQTATDSLGLIYSLHSRTWTHQWSNPTGYDSTSIDGVVGQAKFDQMAYTEVNGFRFGIYANTVNGVASWNVFCEDQYAISGSIFAEYANGTLGNVAAACPVPGHKYLIDVNAVNNGSSPKTATMSALAGPVLAVGMYVRFQNGGSIYKLASVGAPSGGYSVCGLTLVYGSAETLATGRWYQYAPQPAQWEYVKFSATDDAAEKTWSEVRATLDDLSTVTASSIAIKTWSEVGSAGAAQSSNVPPAVPSSLARIGVESASNVGRRISVRCTHSNPVEFLFIRGLRYSYEPLVEDRADT